MKKLFCLVFILLLASFGCGLGGKASSDTSAPPAPSSSPVPQLQVAAPVNGAVSEGRSFSVRGIVTPGAAITVRCVEGGVEVKGVTDANGNYSAEVPAEAGTNTLTITAEDVNGKSFTSRQVVRNARFLLATARCEPNWTDSTRRGPIFLFLGNNKETLANVIPATSTRDPAYVAFSPGGELFVGNRFGVTSGLGSISRFLVDDTGAFQANGEIIGPDLSAVHGLAFSPSGELFAANFRTATISRFTFDPAGNAVPNGSFANGHGWKAQGLAFSPWGELFHAADSGKVTRFLFDPVTGAAVPNGSFIVPGASGLHGLVFSGDGELFLADGRVDTIFRYTFDADRNPVANGSFPQPGGPVGLAWSPARELFVATHRDLSGGLYRYLVNNPNEVETGNGFIPLGQLGGVAIREKEAR